MLLKTLNLSFTWEKTLFEKEIKGCYQHSGLYPQSFQKAVSTWLSELVIVKG